jgi:hypothetical protein
LTKEKHAMARPSNDLDDLRGSAPQAGAAASSLLWGYRPRTLLLAAASLAAVSGAAYLFTEHPQHSLPYLPYLLLAACPLMHFFHHGRHH